MIYTASTFQEFLASTPPFDRLSRTTRDRIAEQLKPLRYHMGQAIFTQERLSHQLAILHEGRVRLLGTDPRSQTTSTLKLLEPGALFGWVGLLRGIPCETAIASTESVCLTLPAAEFLDWLEQDPNLGEAFRDHADLSETFTLLAAARQRQANSPSDLDLVHLAQQACDRARTAASFSFRKVDLVCQQRCGDQYLGWQFSGFCQG